MVYPVIGRPETKNAQEFVCFWSKYYYDPRERIYWDNICRPLTAERVRSLYLWKNGGNLSRAKQGGVEANVVKRLDELNTVKKSCDPLEFLTEFARGGMIWRIFLLHIWQPQVYPIYDQHVYRAMCYVRSSGIVEMPRSYSAIAKSYVEEYIPFYNGFPKLKGRVVDKTLWVFGKFLKSYSAMLR